MTDMFARATQGTGHMAQAFQSIQSGLDKVGAKADFSGGFLKANTELRTTNDMINLFTKNLDEAKTRYSKLLEDFTNPKGKIEGVRIKLLDENELNNAKKLRNAITRINKSLNTKTDKTPEQILALTQFRDFYKSHLKELNRSDADRVNEVIKAARREFDEKLKTLRALAREVKKIEQENAKATKDAEDEKLMAARATAEERRRLSTIKEQKQELKDVTKESKKASGTSGEADARAEISARLLNLQDQINTSTRKGYELYVRTGEQLRQNEALLTKNALKAENAKVTLDQNGGALSLGNVESLVKTTNDVKALRNAFEAIKKAKNDINPNTEEGRKQIQRLNEALAMTGRRIDECRNRQSLFMQGFNRLQSSGAGMSNMFSRIFATSAIMGFTNKVVKLHSEFEKLRKSLAVLVQGSEKANLIWGKITRLAVKSPFTVSDLATATRQMAAYRIEQDLIYQKTKMLADVSAGLGVEMSRLILAYGQVKAANFLRGTELRQFSEAGIDMLGQLATYFTQLEGRLVTAADVMERISKRQVMFEDVDEVLQRVTSRGGAFYKMQEEMATTVAGRISNLKDEFMLSMDNIGKSHNETILKAIRILKWLAQNLDVVIEKVGFMLKLWLAWKTTTIVNTVLVKGYATAMSLFTLATYKATEHMNRLTKATIAFNAASKGNAILALASLAVGIAGAFFMIPDAVDSAAESIEENEMSEEMDHMADLAKDVAAAFAEDQQQISELSNKILALTKSIKILNEADSDSIDNTARLAAMLKEREVAFASLSQKASEYAAQLGSVLDNEDALAKFMERENTKRAAKTVLGDEAKKINMGKATDALSSAYEMLGKPMAYSGGNEYDAKKVREWLDPDHLFPEWVFEDEDKIEENVNLYISTVKNAKSKFESLAASVYRPKQMINYANLKGDPANLFTAELYDIIKDDKLDKAMNSSKQLFNNLMNDIRIGTPGFGELHGTKDKIVSYLDDSINYMYEALAKYNPDALLKDANVTTFVQLLVDAVNKSFDTSALSSGNDKIAEKAQRDIQSFLDSIFVAYDIPDDAKLMLQQILADKLSFKWEDFGTPLELWHENFNKYTDEIRASLTDMDVEIPFSIRKILSGDLTKEDAKKAIEEDLKAVNEVIRIYEDNINSGVSRLATEIEVENMRYLAAIEEFMRLGGDYDDAINYFDKYPDAIAGWSSAIGDIQYVGGVYSTAQYEEAKAQQPALEEALKFHGADKDKDKNKKVTSEAIKAINDVHKAFKDLQKDFDDGTAKVGAWEKYGHALEEALKPFNMSLEHFREQFDLTTEDGMIKAFEWLKKQEAAAAEAYEIERAIGDVTWELNIENKNKADEELNREIEELFSGYELSVELEDLHIPKDLAQKFFDIDVTDINQLRKTLYSRKGEFVGTEQQEEYQNFLDKLDEMEAKSQQERLKKYLEFSRDAMGERGKILFESFGELQDIAKAFELTDTLAKNEGLISDEQLKKMREAGITFDELMSKDKSELMSDAWGFTQEDLDKIKEYNDLLEEQQAIAEDASRKKTNEELAKFDWEKFTGSKVYQDLYNDMSNASSAALTVLINKLEEHRDQWSKLPVDQVEEYVRLLEEAKDALANTKFPSEIISDAKAIIEKSGYSDSGDASKKMINAQLEIESLDIAISQWETIARLKEEGNSARDISLMLNISEEKINAENVDALKTQKTTQEGIVSKSKEYLEAVRKIQDAYDKQKKNLDKIKTCVDKVWEGWDDINSIFGDDSMSTAIAGMVKGVSDASFGMGDMIIATKSAIEGFKTAEDGAQAMGFAIDTASSILGVIVMGVKVVATVLKFAFEQHDKMLQKQIDAQLEKVEVLKDRYEELEKQIEKAYTAIDFGRLTREANENLEDQIEATEKMIALEEDKKKPDDNAIDSWEDEIKDMRNTIEESFEEAFSTLSDGILDDVIGTTRNFVDAWHDAYEETGDGMRGLEETFTDMLKSMLRQQVSMQLISPFIKKYQEWLKDYINPEDGDDMLTADEARMWSEKVRDTFPEVNELLENFFEGTQGLLETGGELSDLEKGIQGMTEDQAEVLASYWNSCRFLLSNIDVTLTKLAESVMSNNPSSTTMLNELRTQTTVLKEIRDSLSSVIGFGGESGHSGSYVKVFM
jgi:DNA repair exonuclease SbcCD ATPase subunit